MRKKCFMFYAITAAVLAIILLTGCQRSSMRGSSQSELPKTSSQAEIHIPAPIDTSAMDEEFYRRMREFPESPSDR